MALGTIFMALRMAYPKELCLYFALHVSFHMVLFFSMRTILYGELFFYTIAKLQQQKEKEKGKHNLFLQIFCGTYVGYVLRWWPFKAAKVEVQFLQHDSLSFCVWFGLLY